MNSLNLPPKLYQQFFTLRGMVNLVKRISPTFDGTFKQRAEHRDAWLAWEKLFRKDAPDEEQAARLLKEAEERLLALPNLARRDWYDTNEGLLECEWKDPISLALCFATTDEKMKPSWSEPLIRALQRSMCTEAVILRSTQHGECVLTNATLSVPTVLLQVDNRWSLSPMALNTNDQFEQALGQLDGHTLPMDLSAPVWGGQPQQLLEAIMLDPRTQRNSRAFSVLMWALSQRTSASMEVWEEVEKTTFSGPVAAVYRECRARMMERDWAPVPARARGQRL